MKIIVTGAGGFTGRHLAGELAQHGHAVVALDSAFRAPVEHAAATVTADLRDRPAIGGVIASARPDACVHLAAISFVPTGDADPGLMLTVNIGGTLNLLDAVRRHATACRLLVVSTSQLYGPVPTDELVSETAPAAPVTLYAASKAAADGLALGYARRFALPVMTARPTNHTGPGQTDDFFVASFVRQVKDIAAGRAAPVIRVGNLDSERPLLDARDVVRAYRLIVEKGLPGEAYNISAPDRIGVGQVLDRLCELAGVQPERRVDPGRFRPTDRFPVLDTAKLRRTTNWTPEIALTRTLADMLAAL
ncbi:MAG: GDP-mannose 4,6-dehydratase [Verrucomicrobiota bacterium]|nr:GDP-mannose 4,6-dehydratase [Verrucomicrobiota bacterium]